MNKLTVLGAGVLGGQIAWQSAFKGKAVVVYDLYEAGLEQCRGAQQQYADIYRQSLDANAAMTLVVNGVATPETVDRTFMIANRGCQLGPCGMLDIVGMTT
ncbi:MAG: 3-hydroxyacyl-CoA dehydrogenase NAD-binding domain-containing protein, partial [Halieaceae bacterium]|nr:3-hydroxyacyl-CoA dehydrogenase NAD-binding domain-containing protein [Halieaceae bacterium]